MLLAGGLWVVASSAALAVGGEAGSLLLGISSNILVFYGFYQAWVRQSQEEQEDRRRDRNEEAQISTEEQLEREVGR